MSLLRHSSKPFGRHRLLFINERSDTMMLTDIISAACTWEVVCSPYTPHTPFGSPLLIVWDTARTITILACVVTLTMIPKGYSVCVTSGQRARLFALVLWLLQDITTEATHLGDDASIRLLFNLGAALIGLYGIYMMRKELPAQPLES